MMTILKKFGYLFILTLLFFSTGSKRVWADSETKLAKNFIKSWSKDALKPYLLPKDHPLYGKLKMLLRTPRTLDSIVTMRMAGFTILKRNGKGFIVARHKNFSKYIFKVFAKSCSFSLEKQLDSLMRRIEGANILRNYISEHNFNHLVVPKKWIYALPSTFSIEGVKRYLLVVEKIDIENLEKTQKKYAQISQDAITELCLTLHAVRGCDAYPRNQPITHSGQIAFIDTEDVGRYFGNFVQHIVPVLNEKLQKYALDLWHELERERWRKFFEEEEEEVKKRLSSEQEPLKVEPQPLVEEKTVIEEAKKWLSLDSQEQNQEEPELLKDDPQILSQEETVSEEGEKVSLGELEENISKE